MVTFDGTPFQYNPTITNVNIDNQLAGILSQFNDDYIMDIIKDSIDDRFRLYSLPHPNIVSAFETTFKQLTDGFSANNDDIIAVRRRVYLNIIDFICDYYNFTFSDSDDTDYYSAAYWLYDFLVSNFTENLKNFYTFFLINERNSIYSSLGLGQLKKDSDATFAYSKKLFNDEKLAAIHCNLEYVISQISTLNLDLQSILTYVYPSNANIPGYITGLIKDNTGLFFKNFYQSYVIDSRDSADILTYIKLSLQQLGGNIESAD